MRTAAVLLPLCAALVAVSPASAAGLKGARLAPLAKVPLATARRAALAARPGTILDQELEKERGGSGLRYSFDIRSAGRKYEVGVDARTGAILENGVESKAD